MWMATNSPTVRMPPRVETIAQSFIKAHVLVKVPHVFHAPAIRVDASVVAISLYDAFQVHCDCPSFLSSLSSNPRAPYLNPTFRVKVRNQPEDTLLNNQTINMKRNDVWQSPLFQFTMG